MREKAAIVLGRISTSDCVADASRLLCRRKIVMSYLAFYILFRVVLFFHFASMMRIIRFYASYFFLLIVVSTQWLVESSSIFSDSDHLLVSCSRFRLVSSYHCVLLFIDPPLLRFYFPHPFYQSYLLPPLHHILNSAASSSIGKNL